MLPLWYWAGWLMGCHFPTDQDGAEPNANSVAVTNLLRAACYSGHMDWVEKAGQILAAFSERLLKIPVALPEMARATAAFHRTLKQVGLRPACCVCVGAGTWAALCACVSIGIHIWEGRSWGRPGSRELV